MSAFLRMREEVLCSGQMESDKTHVDHPFQSAEPPYVYA